jgi:tRNA-splicing ligase RtcB
MRVDGIVYASERIMASLRRELLAEEPPQTNKNVEGVTEAAEGAGLPRRVARLRPVAVIKG